MRNAPDGGASQRRQQHAPHRVAERVTKAALERLKTEFGGVGVVFALRRFDELRTDKSLKSIAFAIVVVSDSSRAYPAPNAR